MEEYISKHDLIKFLDNIQQPKPPITEGFKYITIEDAISVVSERPVVDVAPVIHARWIPREFDKYFRKYECSNCSGIVYEKEYYIKYHQHCLHCGAIMDKE